MRQRRGHAAPLPANAWGLEESPISLPLGVGSLTNHPDNHFSGQGGRLRASYCRRGFAGGPTARVKTSRHNREKLLLFSAGTVQLTFGPLESEQNVVTSPQTNHGKRYVALPPLDIDDIYAFPRD